MTVTADEALRMLRDGNRRFAGGVTRAKYTAEERGASLQGQNPWAVVIGCSDSRVPVEAVFDVGVGELFVVRSAGHVIAKAGHASVRFAVEMLGAELVVILGHEDCGAVKAVLSGNSPSWLDPVTNAIDVRTDGPEYALPDADDPVLAVAVDAHVRNSVRALRDWFRASDISRSPTVIGATYRLVSGEVHWLD